MKWIHSKSFVFFLIIFFIIYATTSETVYSQSKDSDSRNPNEIVEKSGSVNNTNGGYSSIRGKLAPPKQDWTLVIVLSFVVTILIIYKIVSNSDDNDESDDEEKIEQYGGEKAEPAVTDTLSINTN